MSETSSKKKAKLLSDLYVIINKLGSGSFGEVYLAQYKDGDLIAAKVENKKSSESQIMKEYRIYKYLAKHNVINGIPKIYDFIQTPDYNILLMELLEISLEDLFIKNNKYFPMEMVYMIAIQSITLLENVHKNNLIHRDIKPGNFMIGKEDKADTLYLVDFGLSKRYIDLKGKHIPFKDGRSLIGTARYASINMHLSVEPSRRDDLESVGYMLVYFLKGVLPWQNLKKNKQSKIDIIEKIGHVKLMTPVDILCEGLPECFSKYIEYTKGLKFAEEPDYQYLRDLFENSAKESNIIPLLQKIEK